MRLVYTFTPDEKRVVSAAYQKYLDVLGIVAQLHQVMGRVVVTEDFSGFLDPTPQPPEQGPQPAPELQEPVKE